MNETLGPQADWRQRIDLSKYLPKNGATISVTFHYKMKKVKASTNAYGGFYFYDSDIVSEAHLVAIYTDRVVGNKDFMQCTFTTKMDLENNILYMCYYVTVSNWHSGEGSSYYEKIYFTDIWFDLTYPDTSYLYL